MTDTPKPNRRGLNLSQADRERGGKTSAARQAPRFPRQFAGSNLAILAYSHAAQHQASRRPASTASTAMAIRPIASIPPIRR